MKVCLVCSSGGHFYELYCLKEAWSSYDRIWVTFLAQDTRHILEDEKVYRAFSPTNRSLKNLVRNLILAWRVLRKERPRVLISTGAGVCVPFFLIAPLWGIKTVYVESLARIEELSLTGRLVYRFVDEFIVQWPELAEKYNKAKYEGQLL
jgi:UDP-N-acetylglucosamine:LPS N-acetylglucosamine transferase